MNAPAEPPPPPPEPPRKPTLEAAMGPFAHTQYRFTTGLRSGEVADIRGAGGQTLLTYRSFAGIVGVIAAFVSALVLVAGAAAVLLLLTQDSPLRAGVAALLTLAFSFFIARLAPRISVTLYDEAQPALTIAQRATFPSASYLITAPNGATLAEVRKSAFSRLGRHRWSIHQDGRPVGEAIEESFFGAMLRKLYGKFSRRFETNVRVTSGGIEAARILRRPDSTGRVDVLDVTSDALDRRVLVALATLILGREP